MYIIYRDNKFVGYTDDKMMMKVFMNNRRDGTYKFKKIKKSKIPKKIRESRRFEDYSMEYYNGYRISTELPLFLYEFEDLNSDLSNDLLALTESLHSISEAVKYLKLSKNEKEIIKKSMNYINELIDCCTFTHEPVFDEVIDVIKYVNKPVKDTDGYFAKLKHQSSIY